LKESLDTLASSGLSATNKDATPRASPLKEGLNQEVTMFDDDATTPREPTTKQEVEMRIRIPSPETPRVEKVIDQGLSKSNEPEFDTVTPR